MPVLVTCTDEKISNEKWPRKSVAAILLKLKGIQLIIGPNCEFKQKYDASLT